MRTVVVLTTFGDWGLGAPLSCGEPPHAHRGLCEHRPRPKQNRVCRSRRSRSRGCTSIFGWCCPWVSSSTKSPTKYAPNREVSLRVANNDQQQRPEQQPTTPTTNHQPPTTPTTNNETNIKETRQPKTNKKKLTKVFPNDHLEVQNATKQIIPPQGRKKPLFQQDRRRRCPARSQ